MQNYPYYKDVLILEKKKEMKMKKSHSFFWFLMIFVALVNSLAFCEEHLFRKPFGIAVKADGSFYVAEINGKCISKFDAGGNYAGEIKNIEGYGELKGPFDVDVSDSGNIYIADTAGHSVIVLDAEEKLIMKLGSGEPSTLPGNFHLPHSVVPNEELGFFCVADTHNNRIQIFDMMGKFLSSSGKTGRQGPDSYSYCTGVATDKQGKIYAMSWEGAYINIYDSNGKIADTFGKRGARVEEFNDAYSIVCHEDTIWVVDTYNNRLQQFSSNWELLNIIGGIETSDIHGFSHPTDLDFDSKGNIYVVDWKNDRILKLDPTGHFTRKWGTRALAAMQYTPPVVYQRDSCRGTLKLGTYSAVSKEVADLSSDNKIDWIYYSCGNQGGNWAVGTEDIDYAHKKGIKVGISIAVFPLGGDMEKWKKNPEYYMRKKGGGLKNDSIGLSYFYPEVRTWKAKHIAQQIKRLNLDGIFLDYIRYPNNLYGYEPAMIKAFMEETGRDANKIPSDDWEWLKFRAKYITLFISELRYELAQLERPVEISVFIGYDWKKDVETTMRDWQTWARMGIIDKIDIGTYTRDIQSIYEEAVKAKQACPEKIKVNMMLCCWGGNLNTPELLKKGAEVAVSAGVDELTIYRGDAIDKLELWDAIGDISSLYRN